MSWFDKMTINFNEIDTSSRMAAKLSCLRLCKGNVAQSKELYNFVVGDLKDIPDLTPPVPTAVEQAKTLATETWNFVNNNQNQLLQGYAMIQALRNGASPAELLSIMGGAQGASEVAAAVELPTI